MSNYLILPLISLIIFPIVTITMMVKANQPRNIKWIIPAAFCLAFLAFSIVAISTEGPLGFWANHTQDYWGNQVWLDLLLALGVSWCLLVPKAKELGMKLPLWLLFIACSGSIGMLAMFSRSLYLQNKE